MKWRSQRWKKVRECAEIELLTHLKTRHDCVGVGVNVRRKGSSMEGIRYWWIGIVDLRLKRGGLAEWLVAIVGSRADGKSVGRCAGTSRLWL